MDTNDNIFERIKNAAQMEQDTHFAGMDNVWKGIEERLDQKEEKKVIPIWQWLAAASILLLVGIGGYQFFAKNKPQAITASKQIQPTTDTSAIIARKTTTTPSKNVASTHIPTGHNTKHIAPTIAVKHSVATTEKPKTETTAFAKNNTLQVDSTSITTAVIQSASNALKTNNIPELVNVQDFSRVKKAAIVGSEAMFSKSEIKDVPVSNFSQMLQAGKVAGLNIPLNSVIAGASGYITLRGLSQPEITSTPNYSLSKTSDKISDNDLKKYLKNSPITLINGKNSNIGPLLLRHISPLFVNTIEVLKDSDQKAKYGIRSSQDVIAITTKNKNYTFIPPSNDSLISLLRFTIAHPPFSTYGESYAYDSFEENKFESPTSAPLSTFSIDVDNASYTNIRRMINNGAKVPHDAVRIEEMINFFKYNAPQPTDDRPFTLSTEYSQSPWNPQHQLLKITLQGKKIPEEKLPASNLVFLIDISGSMSDENKLPLLKAGLKLLVQKLRPVDRVAIVTYASGVNIPLQPTSGSNKESIIKAIDNLQAGGGTSGQDGIEKAYQLASEYFIKNGNNRIVLATDGDFNIGATSDKEMADLIEEKRKSNIFLTCLGLGMGNYKDSKIQTLADKGNGNYAYIDNMQEANRFLVKEFGGSMFTIAKDVKIQVEFNPSKVQAYRLIGYENRKLKAEDFVNDSIDAGELGSGHTVTALYEIIPPNVKKDPYFTQVGELRYTRNTALTGFSNELANIKLRYKKPDGNKSMEIVQQIEDKAEKPEEVSPDFKLASTVAWWGLQLRNSELIPNKSTNAILNWGRHASYVDTDGYIAEMFRLIELNNK